MATPAAHDTNEKDSERLPLASPQAEGGVPLSPRMLALALSCAVLAILLVALVVSSCLPHGDGTDDDRAQPGQREDPVAMTDDGAEGDADAARPPVDLAPFANVPHAATVGIATMRLDAHAHALRDRIDAACADAGMLVEVAVRDLDSCMAVSVRGDERLPSASMIKLLVASCLLQRIEEGSAALDDTLALGPEDVVGGSGSLGWRGAGAVVSYRELLHAMIAESDNTATNALIGALGQDAINAEAHRLGLSCTSLGRRMMDEEARAAGVDNYTCANDMAAILQGVWTGEIAGAELRATMVDALEDQQDLGGILLGLPAGTVFAHKTGALADVRHDGGIVEGAHPYVLVVLCGGDGFYEQRALAVMAEVARIVHADLGA